ncbi:MAG: peptidoglycan bridge formation glycyltransferase FemA/FemB family protein [Elusimicrobia bacterium]|nr:peptidoglycan bridge formation glycyltransferase FemA/FemB family protein [Elusimicrobiota bacterium]
MNWRAFAGDDAAWDAALAAVPSANAFQTSAWARHKADFGWRPVRVVAGPDDAPLAAAQALVKSAPGGARLLWARGGPVGDPGLWNAGLRAALADAAGGTAVYGRVCSYRELDAASEAFLAGAGWTRPARPLDRNRTYLLDLTPEPEPLKEGLSSNWRHNLKRGNARAVVVDWTDPDPAGMEAVYREMEALKGLPPQHRADELRSLVRALGGTLVLKRALVDGKTVALRACAVFGGSATDLLAAATAEARKVYASYALLWALILESRRRGARTYDLGGADPDAARGVADFKSGLGAKAADTVGEWDFARPAFLRGPAGALIAWKLGKGG